MSNNAFDSQAISEPTREPLAAAEARPLAWWTLLLLAIAAFAVYANSLKNGFALDDLAIVQGNDHVINLHWLQIWVDNYWPRQNGLPPDILYRPLTIWSYLATHAFFSNAAWVFHLGNVLLHALVTVMVAVLAQRLVGSRPIAFITGLLFALHPLHTEVVANVVGRAELMSAAFSLAALLVFLPTTPVMFETSLPKRSIWHGLLVGLCFFLAMLCKESPAALIFAFPLIDVCRYARTSRFSIPSFTRWMLRQALRYYLPILGFFGIYLALRYNACGVMRAPGCSPLVNPIVDATLAQRVVTPFALLAKYLQLTAWPRVLSSDYSFPSLLPTANPLSPLPLAGICLTALALLAAFKQWRKAPYVALVVGLFACSYALVANFLPIGTIMGERLFYLPSLFVLLIVSALGWNLFRLTQAAALQAAKATGNRGHVLFVRGAGVCLLAILCIAMTVRTVIRNTDWQDNITLAISTARDNPSSAKACFWAGNVLAANDAPEQFKPLGRQLLQRSIELFPGYGPSYFELAKVSRLQNDLVDSTLYLGLAALYAPGKDDVTMALDRIVPDLAAHNPDQYLPDLIACAQANPHEAVPQFALALAFRATGDLDHAEDACMAAIAAKPSFHEAANELAMIELEKGKDDRAIHLMLRYIAYVRSNPLVRLILASTLLKKDAARFPDTLVKAERLLREVDMLTRDNPLPVTRELRAQIAQKRSALALLGHSTQNEHAAPTLAASGGLP
jgi:tetratricopeptide (TPR) repeat protein